ncbi:hypothetical protein SuNHUV7_40670 (plasmid) [Pseudoseohaeicola sp. NH-UV-7]|uniref:Hint domain-containing protein n=1 Tax=Sulfitobacter sp. TBRI5 TaxID=2989732 RepID=UPI003A710757
MAKLVVTTSGTTIVVKNGDSVLVDIVGGGTVTIVAAPDANIKNLKIDFGGNDHVADEVEIDLSTFQSYSLHIDINDYDPTDSVVLNNAFNRHVDPGKEDEYNFEYIGANGATFNGFLRAKDKGEKDFTDQPPPIVICFAQGTIIDATLGPTPVECLTEGDLVRTRDNDDQPIRWIGRRRLDSLELARRPNLAPVRIHTGALGRGLPHVDLTVSPQHRILVEGWQAELHFGESEILVPAIALVNGKSVRTLPDIDQITYYHLLFDQHEIITANGAPTESMLTGEMALLALDQEAQHEIQMLFESRQEPSGVQRAARPILRQRDAAIFKVA